MNFFLRSLLFGVFFTFVCSFGLFAQAPKAIINEWSQGRNSTTGEWVEILILDESDNFTLGGWYLTDGANTALFKFANDFPKLPKGTILLVYMSPSACKDTEDVKNPIDCSYPKDYHPNMPATTEIHACDLVVDPNNSKYINTQATIWASGNNSSNSDNNDNYRLFDAFNTLVHDWDNNNDPALIAKRPKGGQAVYFKGGNLNTIATDIFDANLWENVAWNSNALTPGKSNGGANTTLVNLLKSNALSKVRIADTSPITRPEGTRTKITFYRCNARGNEGIDLYLNDPDPPFTAIYGTDYYTEPAATDNNSIVELSFLPGKDTVSVDVITKSDCDLESDKFFFIRFTASNTDFVEESFRFTITDVPPQNLAFSLAPNGSITVCTKQTQNFEVRKQDGNLLPDPSLYTYQWMEASGKTQQLNSTTIYNPSFKPTTTGTYTFTVMVTDKATQCSTEVKEIIVTVIDQPTVTIEISPQKPDDQYCEGDVITLTAKIVPDNLTNVNYGWNHNLPNQSSVNYTITNADVVAGTVDFTLRVSVNGQCPADAPVKIIKVARKPAFNFDPNPATMTICKGEDGDTLFISNLTPTNAVISPNFQLIADDNNGNRQYKIPPTNQTYQIIFTDPATQCTSESVSLVVTVDQNDPVIVVKPKGVPANPNNEYCEGTIVDLVVQNRNGSDLSPGTTFLWSNGNTTNQIQNLELTVGISDYSVQVTVPGCDGIMATPNPIQFIVNPKPILLNPPRNPLPVCIINRNAEYDFNFQDASTKLQGTWTPNTVQGVGDPNDHVYSFPAVTGDYTATFELKGCPLEVTVHVEAINEYEIFINGSNTNPYIVPPICPGETFSVSLTLSNGGVPAGVFAWTPSDPNAQLLKDFDPNYSQGKIDRPTSNQPIRYTIDVTDVNGCPVKQAVIDVKAGEAPNVTAEIDNPKAVYCHNETVTLTASCSCPNGIEWSSPDFPTFTSTDPQPVTPELPNTETTPKTYTFILKGTSADGCSEEKPISITIQPQPKIAFTTNMPNNATEFCEGGNMRLTLDVTPAGNYTYSWGGLPSGITSNNNVLTASNFSQALAGTFTVTVTDANNCTNSTNISITVKTPTPVNITSNNNGILCEGDQLTLTANPANLTNYQWYKGGTAITGATSATYTKSNITTATDQGSYTVSATDAGGCSTTSTPIMVTVNPRPIIANSVFSAKAICAGDKVTINGSYTINPMTGVTAVNPTTFDLAPTTTTTYTLTLTDANGCQSESKTLAITVNPLPNIQRIDAKTGCLGQPITLKVRGADTYQWLANTSAGTPETLVDSIVFTPNTTGTFTFTVLGTNTATNCVSIATGNITVMVNELPILGTAFAGRIKISDGDTTRLFVTNTTGTELIWSPSDNLTKTADIKEVIVAPKTTTDYTVKAVLNGCESDPQTVRVEVEPYVFEISTVFTPNGDDVNDVLRYSFDNLNVRSFQIVIMDRWGQKVFESNSLNDFWNGKANNSGENVPAGTYVMAMKITRNDGKVLEKNQIVTLIR